MPRDSSNLCNRLANHGLTVFVGPPRLQLWTQNPSIIVLVGDNLPPSFAGSHHSYMELVIGTIFETSIFMIVWVRDGAFTKDSEKGYNKTNMSLGKLVLDGSIV